MNDTISKRAQKALTVLLSGGYFVERLERNYLGHMKFVTRLHDAAGAVVRGIGGQTRRELAFVAGGALLNTETHSAGSGHTFRLRDPRTLPAEYAVRFDAVLEGVSL
jgi:hypothetical protein